MQLQFPLLIWPVAIAVVIPLLLAFVVWQRQPSRQSLPVLFLLSGIVQWSASNLLELIFVDLGMQVFFASIKYIGVTSTVAGWFIYAISYTDRQEWLTRRTLLLLAIEPVVTIAVVLSNPWHGLFWSRITPVMTGGMWTFATEYGLAFWIHTAYSYALLAVASGHLLYHLLRARNLIRSQLSMLLIAVAAPWLANLLYLTGHNPLAPIDLTPLAFAITGTIIAWSFLRFQLFDLIPVARTAVIERMPDGMLVLDAQNRIVDINPTMLDFLHLKRSENVVGRQIGETLRDSPVSVLGLSDLDSSGSSIIPVVGDTGQQRYYELRISPLTNQSGQSMGSLVLARDVTEHRKALDQIQEQYAILQEKNVDLVEARLRADEANRLKSEFLAMMSHELRTPLNAIIGYTDLQLIGAAGSISERQQYYLERVIENAEHLLTIINDLLDIAKIESGRLEITRQMFRPADLETSVTNRVQSLIMQRNLVFETHLDPNLPESLLGDRYRLEQIAINLLGNAIKFTETGKIEFEIRREDDTRWSMRVTDSGVGIPEEAQRYIFEEFRQVDSSVRRSYGGTGLGLAIVKRLLEMMGGTVSVRSAPGQGSTFTVYLPLIQPEPAVALKE